MRLVEAYGVTLKKHGKDYLGRCPFHNDKTPSLVISPKTNLWHCLGACNVGGSTIDWIMKTQNVSFRHAVELLRDDVAFLAAKEENVQPASPPKLDNPVTVNADDQAMLWQVINYYHDTLKQSEEVQQYLAKRGLYHAELIERFKLGYANRSLGLRLPAKNRKDGAAIREQLQRIGLYRDTGREHFNGSLVVPVINEQGQITEVYGRKTIDRLRKGTPKHTYLPHAHAGVWNAAALQGQTEIILCEALLDAMTFWVNGYQNVTASYGTSGFTDDHLACFKRYQVERVLIAYDPDEAGNNAAAKLAEQLAAEGIHCYRLLFPKGMDVNAYALNVQPAAKSLGVVIRSAKYMGEGDAPELTQVAQPLMNDEVTPELDSTLSLAAKKATSAPQRVDAAAQTNAAPITSIEEAEPTLPASAVPPAPVEPATPDVKGHEVLITFGSRRYRVRGLQKNTSYEVLKVNVLLQHETIVHVDSFDLYSAKHRLAFARTAAAETGLEDKLIQRDLGQLLLQLEGLQDKAIQAALQPKEPTAYTMDEGERKQALALLRDPQLANRIVEDFGQTGLVGEPVNALMGYLAAVSRKLHNPLAIIVQSTSAAGKSALMDAVLKLIPDEDKVQYSAMTGQSLFYLGETNLKHKILGISEEEGVRQAAYALKLLQSQGELTIASTGKDPQSGKLVTEEYRVEGPVMLFLTTTAIDIDEELLNRCVVLTINESREQTAAIQQRQRQARTLAGLLASNTSEQLIKQHQNAQRLLRPLAVVNPYAEQLGFADSRTRTRRDHEKYLTLIDCIALLHQHQREIKRVRHQGQSIEYIEATVDDIALANRLAHEILGRSLDELPPPTRHLLGQLRTLVNKQCEVEGLRPHEVRFTRKDIREATGLSNSQVGVHLTRLVELEYVYAHHGRNGQRFIYELAFDGETDNDKPQLAGLIDVAELQATMSNLTDQSPELADSLLPASDAHAAGLQAVQMPVETSHHEDSAPPMPVTSAASTYSANTASASQPKA